MFLKAPLVNVCKVGSISVLCLCGLFVTVSSSIGHIVGDSILCSLVGECLSFLSMGGLWCAWVVLRCFVLVYVLRILYLPYCSVYSRIPGPRFVVGRICTLLVRLFTLSLLL